MLNPLISIAPMMDWTDRHYRYFLRLISPHAFLYTEMVTTPALLQGKKLDLLAFHPSEHPIALQLGGSDPHQLSLCAKIGEAYGYDEINLNVGCPSDRVQTGRFGACLMAEPNLVAECISSMNKSVSIPVTVKTRIGIDNQDSYENLCYFITTVAQSGCDTFILHARKAWLKGLSPKENREIPPLRYDIVRKIKQDYPALKIILNGGLKTINDVQTYLSDFDGLMIGREAYHNPYFLAEIEKKLYHHNPLSRFEIIEQFFPYIEEQLQKGVKLHQITRHILGLFHGEPGARGWRRYLSENARLPNATIDVLKLACNFLNE
ncbi:MAG: tRNA-dihydrouridine(20/20a) synthase [Legionellaceae bacterium]